MTDETKRKISKIFEPACVLGAFERLVAAFLSIGVVALALTALWRLAVEIWGIVAYGGNSEALMRTAFGTMMTVLITIEFGHSIVQKNDGKILGPVKVKTIILIAIMAVSRGFMMTENQGFPPWATAASALALLALGAVYKMLDD